MIGTFLYWISERHHIHVLRQAQQPRPWTDDPIMESVFFTNPYRENDKTTIWFRENIRGPLAHDPRVVFATCVFRWFNWVPTAQVLMGPPNLFLDWDGEEAKRRLRGQERIFTSAHQIGLCTAGTESRLDNIVNHGLARLHSSPPRGPWPSMRAAFECLQAYPGMRAGFVTQEVVKDLRFTDFVHPSDARTWAHPGPGSMRGMWYILDHKPSKEEWLREAIKLLDIAEQRLGMPFELADIEHSLCEFYKYMCVQSGDPIRRRFK